MKNRMMLGLALVIAAAPAVVVAAPKKPARAPKASRAHKFSASQAAKIALAKYPGKVTGPVKLENEEHGWEYAVTIQSPGHLREVMVSADTGKIGTVEETSAAEEAKEAAADAKKASSKK